MTKRQAALGCLLQVTSFLVIGLSLTFLGMAIDDPVLQWGGPPIGLIASFAVARRYVGRFDDPWKYARPPGTVDPQVRNRDGWEW